MYEMFLLLYSGVWATRVIPKGKRFGPFVGEKKKRSQVTSNVYMWEVRYRLLRQLLLLKYHARGSRRIPAVKQAQLHSASNVAPIVHKSVCVCVYMCVFILLMCLCPVGLFPSAGLDVRWRHRPHEGKLATIRELGTLQQRAESLPSGD